MLAVGRRALDEAAVELRRAEGRLVDARASGEAGLEARPGRGVVGASLGARAKGDRETEGGGVPSRLWVLRDVGNGGSSGEGHGSASKSTSGLRLIKLDDRLGE